MKELPNRKGLRYEKHNYSSCGAFFVTICTENRKCLLSSVVGTGVLDCPSVKLSPFGDIAKKYIEQLNGFYEHIKVDCYVIMPNHIHMILFIPWNGQSRTPVPTGANSYVSQFISTFKRFCNKEYGKNIWQPRSFDHIIRNQADYQEHKNYIYNNPARWRFDKLYSEFCDE